MGAKSGEDSSKSSGPTRVTASLNNTLNWTVPLPAVCAAGLCLVMDVTVGAGSTTCTVLDTCMAGLSEASVHEKVMTYGPAVPVSTEPEATIRDVMSPSLSSVQVAPESTYVEPTSVLTVGGPTSASTGEVTSAVAVKLYD